jgi:hypothetical protein
LANGRKQCNAHCARGETGGGRGAERTTKRFAIEHDQGMVDLLEATLVAERRKPVIDSAPRWQIAVRQAPRAARPHYIKEALDDLPDRPGAAPSHAIRCMQVRLDQMSFLVGHVRLVSVGFAVLLPSGGWGPHINSGLVSKTPWDHVDPNHSIPFETAF